MDIRMRKYWNVWNCEISLYFVRIDRALSTFVWVRRNRMANHFGEQKIKMMNGGPNVNYTTEMSKIKKGQLQPVYLFLGKEDFFIEEAKQLLLYAVVDEADKDLNVGIFNGWDVVGSGS